MFFSYSEMISGFKANEREEELNTEKAVNFCILETVGEQSLKNANVYEKLNALEH